MRNARDRNGVVLRVQENYIYYQPLRQLRGPARGDDFVDGGVPSDNANIFGVRWQVDW